MKYLIVLIPWVKAWDIHFACIVIKLRQSITDWNLHKTNIILWKRQPYSELFLPTLILNQIYYQADIAGKLTYIITRRSWGYLFSFSFQLIFLHRMINILRHERIYHRIDESITPFITQSIDWTGIIWLAGFVLAGRDYKSS